jgi:hypothetical protein
VNPRVAQNASEVAFDAAKYTWLDLTERNLTDEEIHPHMVELHSYPVEKMPMLFEKMAVIVPSNLGRGVATLERVGKVLHFELWGLNLDSPAIEVEIKDDPEHPGELLTRARVHQEVLADLTRSYGAEKATKMVTDNAGRIVANLYCATMVNSSVTESYTCPSNPANEKRRRKNKLPLYEWKTIVIDPKEVKRVRDAAAPHRYRDKCRQHEVRGHWAVRRKSGKRYWVRAHKRGDPSKGTVFHDYQLAGEKK